MAGSAPDPDLIATRDEFAAALTALRERAGRSVRDLARALDVPSATLGGYFSGRHLPPTGQAGTFTALLDACGVADPAVVERWQSALTRVRRVGTARAARANGSPAPYRGLAAYQPQDAEWFFGRDAAVAAVLDRLAVAGPGGVMLAVLGPSGSGKSSLLRAGVIPALAGGAAGRAGPVALLTPGAQPVAALAAAGAGTAAVVVVDQLEEVFTLCDDPAARGEFLAGLRAAADRGAAVLLGLRADFYAAAAGEPTLLPVLQDQQVLLGPMSRDELRAAITEPARHAGADVDDHLLDLLLAELSPRGLTDAGYHPGALPLLSHALLSTWQRARRGRLTVAAYRETGGIRGAIQQTAEAIYDDIPTERRPLVRRVFLRLVSVDDEGVVTRRRVAREELDSLADPTAVRDVIDRYVAGRLLTAHADAVEVSHEALLAAWPRLADWVDADRAGLRTHRQLTDAAAGWQAADRDEALLLRGGRLALISEWAADPDHAADLSGTEGAYLDASLARDRSERTATRRRTRRLQAMVAVVAVLAMVAAGLAVYAFSARATANRQRRAAQHTAAVALSRQVAIEASRLRATDPALAAQLSVAAWRIAPSTDATSALLDTTATLTPTRLLGPPGPMQAIALSRDGTLLAATGADGAVHLWHLPRTGPPTRAGTLGPAQPNSTLFAVAVSPDGRSVAAAGADKTVRIWSLARPNRPAATLTGPGNTVYSLAFSPDGATLVAGSADDTVHRWHLPDRTQLPALGGFHGYVQSVAFTPDGRLLAAAGADGSVHLWSNPSAATTRLEAAVNTGSEPLFAVATSPDGALLAAGGRGKTVTLLDISHPAHPVRRAVLTGATNWINALAFSPSGRQLAAGSSDNTTHLWTLTASAGATDDTAGSVTAAPAAVLPHPSPVTAVAYTPTRRLVTAATDGVARLWPLSGPALTGPSDSVFALSFTANGHELGVFPAAGDGHAELWNTADPRDPVETATFTPAAGRGHLNGTGALAPDGRLAATGSKEGPVQLWTVADPRRPKPLGAPLTGATNVIESIAISPDGQLLAAGGDDHTVQLWDIADPTHPIREPPLTGSGNYILGIAFDPHSRLLAAASADDTVRLYDLTDPARPIQAAVLRGFSNYAYATAFSPDGHLLAAGGADKTVRLWDITDPRVPKPLATLTGPGNYVLSVAISPDGRTLAAGSTDHTVWLWSLARAAAPAPLAELTASTGSVYTVAFSPNGQLAASGADQQVHLWTVEPAEAASAVCAAAGDPVTRDEWRQYIRDTAYRSPCP